MAETGNSVQNSGWYAYVRYKANKKIEFVPISSVKERQEIGGKKIRFNPKTLTDFEERKWYSVKTFQDSADGEAHRYYALIGKLGESLESLQSEVTSGRRIIWPVIDEIDDSEPLSTAAEEFLYRDTLNPSVASTQEENRNKKKQKKNVTDMIHSRLLNNIEATAAPADVADSPDQSDFRDEVEKLKAQLKDRDAKLKEFERAAMYSTHETTIGIDTFTTKLEELTKSIDSQKTATETRLTELEKRMDEYFSKFSPTVPQHVVDWVHKSSPLMM